MPLFSRIFRLIRLARQRRATENDVNGAPINLQPGELLWDDVQQKLFIGSESVYPAVTSLLGGPGMTLDQVTPPEAAVDFNSQKIVNLADPVSPQDAATKFYVDATATGLDVKRSCRVATTTNITLSGLQTVDGVSLSAGDRVLVKNQTNKTQNGLYVAAAGAWARTTDADSAEELTAGLFTFVEEGSVNLDSGWVLITNQPIVIGSTSIEFSLFSVVATITPGAGLTKDGDTLNVNTANAGRIVVNADNIDLATTGVSAGTYNNVTVDVYGRVTTGSTTVFATVATSGSYTDLLNVPSSFAPSAHKTTHATGGSDALSAADIGAAATSHTHGNITNDGKIGTTAGQIIVTGTDGALSAAATIGTSAVSFAATDRLLGRSSSGGGAGQEIVCTAAGRALLDAASSADQRTTLGLGTLATQNGTFSGTSSGTNTGDQTISLTGDVTGSGTGSFAATLSNTGVTAGTYTRVTVDAKGRVTSASNTVDGGAY